MFCLACVAAACRIKNYMYCIAQVTEVCSSISEEPDVSICSVRDITTDLAVYSVKSQRPSPFHSHYHENL